MHHVEPLREVALTGSERRHGHRRRVLKGAMIVYNDGHCTLGCQILDVSIPARGSCRRTFSCAPPNLSSNPASARHEIVKLSGEKRTPSAYATSDPVK